MHCPFCGSTVNRVVDKRAVQGTGEIRRRRECLKCSRRYTTYEKVSTFGLIVIKRDGRREAYCKEKLLNGIMKALEKRPDSEKAEELASKIEKKLRTREQKEVPSKVIGQAVLSELKKLDKIAYLRFASVYRDFKDASDFAKELETLKILTSQ